MNEKVTFEDRGNISDIIWWIKGYEAADQAGCPFKADHVNTLAKVMRMLRPNTNPDLCDFSDAYKGIVKLPDSAILWLANGDRGVSSEALFTMLTQIEARALHHRKPGHYEYPRDANDFGRCRKMLEACPELKAKFDNVTLHSPEWKALHRTWPEICEQMDEEVPGWRDGSFHAPRTNASIVLVIAIAQRGGGAR